MPADNDSRADVSLVQYTAGCPLSPAHTIRPRRASGQATQKRLPAGTSARTSHLRPVMHCLVSGCDYPPNELIPFVFAGIGTMTELTSECEPSVMMTCTRIYSTSTEHSSRSAQVELHSCAVKLGANLGHKVPEKTPSTGPYSIEVVTFSF